MTEDTCVFSSTRSSCPASQSTLTPKLTLPASLHRFAFAVAVANFAALSANYYWRRANSSWGGRRSCFDAARRDCCCCHTMRCLLHQLLLMLLLHLLLLHRHSTISTCSQWPRPTVWHSPRGHPNSTCDLAAREKEREQISTIKTKIQMLQNVEIFKSLNVCAKLINKN